MSRKKFPLILSLSLLLLLPACGGSAIPSTQETTAAIDTRVAELVAATADSQAAVATAVAATLAAMGAANSPATPSPGQTPSLQVTTTPLPPLLSVSVQTNCRSGPGSEYDVLGVMNVGETAEVVGRSLYANNWVIKLPSNPAVICTIWGQYAAVIGDTSALPVVNPPPTPTPAASFSAAYSATCHVGVQHLTIYQVTNTGAITWESNQITETDLATSVTITVARDYSFDYSGCHSNGPFDMSLEPGETDMFTTDGDWGYDPTGHDIKAVIRLCSQDGLAGICVEQTVTYTY